MAIQISIVELGDPYDWQFHLYFELNDLGLEESIYMILVLINSTKPSLA